LHPQCLFEQSKLVEKGATSLAELDPNNAVCLRRAARWATALRSEELCQSGHTLNHSQALACGDDHHLKPIGDEWLRQFATLEQGDKAPKCDFSQNSAQDNETMRDNLRRNDAFMSEMRPDFPAGEAGRDTLVRICNMDSTVDPTPEESCGPDKARGAPK
jgi:hypothetical protein